MLYVKQANGLSILDKNFQPNIDNAINAVKDILVSHI